MKRLTLTLFVPVISVLVLLAHPVLAQESPSGPGIQSAPEIPFDSVPFLKLTADRNLGEVLGVAVNSKGHVIVLNLPGSAGTGPVYGGSTTQILEFDEKGNYVREIGPGLRALGAL